MTKVDPVKYARLYELAFMPGEVVEIRALGLFGKNSAWHGFARGQVSGYFDNQETFARAAASLEKTELAAGIYYTLNPVKPALLARAANRLKAADLTTSDKDISRIRWFPIDIDPARPAGISADMDELQAALTCRDLVCDFLSSRGWPEPIKAMSGNGAHALYKLDDLDPTEINRDYIKHGLQALSSIFSNSRVNVDEKVFNPARIWKLYGTKGRKGDDTTARPWRISKMDPPPDPLNITGLSLLIELAKMKIQSELEPSAASSKPDTKDDLGPMDIGLYLNRYGIEYNLKTSATARMYRLTACLFDANHTKNEASIIQSDSGLITYQCFHDSCKKRTWHDARALISGEANLAEFHLFYKQKTRGYSTATSAAQTDGASRNGTDRYFIKGKNGRQSFKSTLLADEILDENEICYVPDHAMFLFNGAIWHEIHPGHLRHVMRQKLGLEYNRNRGADTLQSIMDEVILPAGEELNHRAGELICLKNGVLNLATGELEPHSKDHRCSIQVQASYKPEARCPRWLEFWRETLADTDQIKVLQEWTGYCLTRDTKHHKSLFLVGPGQDGKSTYLKVLQYLVGHENRANVTLRDLENEFHRVTLFGKLLNVSTETEFSRALTSDYFKAIVSGDAITAAHKNKPVFSFEPFCKMAFGMNRLPRVRDYSHGFFRRLIIVRFINQFMGADDDKALLDKLISEIDGVLIWALVGLERLEKQGGFTEAPAIDAELAEYKMDNDPVLGFADDELTTAPDPYGQPPSAQKQVIFDAFKKWADLANVRLMGRSEFFRRLKEHFPHIEELRRRSGGERIREIVGIGLNPIGAVDDTSE